MDITNKYDKIYSSLLYQLINTASLVNQKYNLEEYTNYLRDIFDYTKHQDTIKEVRALDKPNRICYLTVIEAVDLYLDDISVEPPPKFFVTVKFDDGIDDKKQCTNISNKTVWNETLSFNMNDEKMNNSFVICIMGNSGKKEGIFPKKVKHTSTSPMEDIVKATKHTDYNYIVGRVRIPLKAITPFTTFSWQVVDNKKNSGKSFIKLQVNYGLQENEHIFHDSAVEYKVLFETLLRYELQKSQVSHYWWDGKFTRLGQSLLEHYIKSKNLSKHITELIQLQIVCDIQATHPLAFSLFYKIISQIYEFICENVYADEELTLFWSSCVNLLENCGGVMKTFNFEDERLVKDLSLTIHKMSSIVSMCKAGLLSRSLFNKDPELEIDKRARDSIKTIIKEASIENARSWFNKILNQEVVRQCEEDGWTMVKNMNKFEIDKLCQLLDKIQERLCVIKDNYADPFKKYMNLDLPYLYFSELEKLYVDHALTKLKCITWCIDYDIDARKNNYDQQKVFLDQFKVFYLKLKGFNESIVKILPPSKNFDKFSNYFDWFDEIITVWFKILGIETRKCIIKAVKLDENLNLEGSKHTSSASDTFDLLYVLLVQFKQIVSVEHDKAFVIASEIVTEIFDSSVTYFDEATQMLNPFWNNKTEKTAIDKNLMKRFSDVINNVEYLTIKASEIIEKIFIHILDSNDAMIVNKKYPGLLNFQENFYEKVSTLMKQFINNKIVIHIQKLLKDAFAMAGKDVNAFESISEYLINVVSQLYLLLTTESLKKLLNLVWLELMILFRTFLQKQTQQDVQVFTSFKRCYEKVKELFDDYVTLEDYSEDQKYVEKELKRRSFSASELIHTYYRRLNEEQEKSTETFGILTVCGEFTDDSLNLRILNGRNIIPRTGIKEGTQPNTYVEVAFYFADPSKYNLKNMKTKTIYKNQFPLYDEILKVPLTKSEQNLDDTIIVFTLWDPDYYGIVQNYLGECSVTLKELRENDKQVMKNLWKPHEGADECLSNLKSRTDKQARQLYGSIRSKIPKKRLSLISPRN